jgi:hypothetical protein
MNHEMTPDESDADIAGVINPKVRIGHVHLSSPLK